METIKFHPIQLLNSQCFDIDEQPLNPWVRYFEISIASCCWIHRCCLVTPDLLIACLSCADGVLAELLKLMDPGRLMGRRLLVLWHLWLLLWCSNRFLLCPYYSMVVYISLSHCRRTASRFLAVPFQIWHRFTLDHRMCCFEEFAACCLEYSSGHGHQPLDPGHLPWFKVTDWKPSMTWTMCTPDHYSLGHDVDAVQHPLHLRPPRVASPLWLLKESLQHPNVDWSKSLNWHML